MTKLRSLLLPGTAVLAGAVAALLFMARGSRSQGAPVATPPPAAAAAPAAGTDTPADAALSGTVLERIPVQRYTYLRIGESGTEGTWVAVPTAEVQVGERVSVRNAQRMTDFQSPTLKRTFPTIYFGELESGPGRASAAVHASAMAPAGDTAEEAMGGVSVDHASGLPGHHMAPQQLAEPVEIGKVAKAPGPLGRTVAQIYAERTQLDGKQVRVRGVVVKAVANVLDRTFVHLRDGTGSTSDNTHDLTVTASAVPNVGDQLLYEGTLTVDKDYGSGYRYQAVLENAHVVAE
jgi:hypothetical protein